jgi:hypothetical protein
MSQHGFQVVGLFGFIASGVLFSTSAIRADDWLSLTGSIVWMAACVLWLVPLLAQRGRADD